MKPGLTVSMIVRNEREMLPRCLESVRGADEIVILDTGSTDDTADVVASMGLPNVRFIAGEYEWQDSFAHARNAAKARCETKWLLTIDADEYLEADGMEVIRAAIEKNGDLAFNIKTAAVGGKAWHMSPRVYRNIPAHDWHGAAHNFQNITRARVLDTTLFYDNSPAHKLDPERTVRILTLEDLKHPGNPRTLYYLGTEWLRRRFYDKAIWCLERALLCEKHSFYAPEIHLTLARCYWQKHMASEARLHCFRAIEWNANFQEAILFMAEMSFEKNAVRWREMAACATNEGVMFRREP